MLRGRGRLWAVCVVAIEGESGRRFDPTDTNLGRVGGERCFLRGSFGRECVVVCNFDPSDT